jgi:DNA replication protein DnaC
MKPFENFDIKFNNQGEEVEIIKNFSKSNKRILVISGSVGVGKTHLVKELKKQYGIYQSRDIFDLTQYESAIFIKSDLLYYVFMEANFPNMEVREIKYSLMDLKRCKCLIIDDLGSEIEDKKGYFRLGIKELIEDCKGKIAITTNLNYKGLIDKYGEKIYSRLCENMQWLNLAGKDYRKKQ